VLQAAASFSAGFGAFVGLLGAAVVLVAGFVVFGRFIINSFGVR
jgi:hypothetical protein